MEQTSTRNGNPQDQKEQKGSAQEHKEGPVARAIEEQTAKLPSDWFLWAAGAAMVASLALEVIGQRRGFFDRWSRKRTPAATFVGQWVPTILLLGVYNKLVKLHGSDQMSR